MSRNRAPSDEILEALSPLYAALLALRARGTADEEIAELLDVPVESVTTLTALAHRKLDRLLGTGT